MEGEYNDDNDGSDGSLDGDNASDLNEGEEDESDAVNVEDEDELEEQVKEESKSRKRKFIDYGGELNAADHRFKIPTSEELSLKQVNQAKLEINIRRRKISMEEKLAMVRAGREDRVVYKARAAVKQKKQEKPVRHSYLKKKPKKQMPIAAKRAKLVGNCLEKKMLCQRAGKQFRGKKAWK